MCIDATSIEWRAEARLQAEAISSTVFGIGGTRDRSEAWRDVGGDDLGLCQLKLSASY